MIESYITLAIIFIIGCSFGSFLSVVIGRTLKNQKGIFMGRSACPKCKHKLSGLDLIPILSWAFRRGKCAYCHKSISIEYPALELITGLLFISNYSALLTTNINFDFAQSPASPFIFWLKMTFLCLTSLTLLSICFADIKTKTIPNIFLFVWITLCLPAVFFSSSPMLGDVVSRLIALAIALGFFGGQYLISRGRWLGSGDIFIAIGMALLLGWEKLVLAMILSYFLGSIIGVILIVSQNKKAKQTIAFGPFLVMGTIISLYFGNQIINWYISTLIF